MDDTATPPAPTVSAGGTERDFGNMLNAYIPHKKRKMHSFSAWTKMGPKQEKIK